MAKICVFTADGFEEIEGLTVVDLLRRAGAEVLMVSVGEGLTVKGAHNIELRQMCFLMRHVMKMQMYWYFREECREL